MTEMTRTVAGEHEAVEELAEGRKRAEKMLKDVLALNQTLVARLYRPDEAIEANVSGRQVVIRVGCAEVIHSHQSWSRRKIAWRATLQRE
mmetsp:Transcript_35730/g.93129  ORF Transcript_35730/g.93129 Transcript_35730/m.93129 type:complete len:90 (-) Transcript_35730:919-1188(-)